MSVVGRPGLRHIGGRQAVPRTPSRMQTNRSGIIFVPDPDRLAT